MSDELVRLVFLRAGPAVVAFGREYFRDVLDLLDRLAADPGGCHPSDLPGLAGLEPLGVLTADGPGYRAGNPEALDAHRGRLGQYLRVLDTI